MTMEAAMKYLCLVYALTEVRTGKAAEIGKVSLTYNT